MSTSLPFLLETPLNTGDHAPHPCSLHRREEVWWPADTSDGNAAETAFRVSFDLSYTLNTRENRITKPLMAIFLQK